MVIFLKYLSIWNTLNTLPQNILLQTTFYFFHTCKIQITKYTKVIKYVFKIHLIEILPMSACASFLASSYWNKHLVQQQRAWGEYVEFIQTWAILCSFVWLSRCLVWELLLNVKSKFEISEGSWWESISSVSVAVFMFTFIYLSTFIFGRLHLLVKIDVDTLYCPCMSNDRGKYQIYTCMGI